MYVSKRVTGSEFGCALLLLGLPALGLGLIGLVLTLTMDLAPEQLVQLRRLAFAATGVGVFFIALWAWLTHKH